MIGKEAFLKNIQPINHKLHIFLSVITGGFWLLFYLPLVFFVKSSPDYAAKIVKKKEEKRTRKQERKVLQATRLTSLATQSRLSETNLGYRPSKSSWDTPWTLECGHSIRTMNSGKQGRSVFCKVCNGTRTVVSTNAWNR
jgi:hypothetical protein